MAVDTELVEQLISGISEVIVEELEGHPTSHSEVVSALFTILDRCLTSIEKMPSSGEKAYNVALINSTLLSLMLPGDKPH